MSALALVLVLAADLGAHPSFDEAAQAYRQAEFDRALVLFLDLALNGNLDDRERAELRIWTALCHAQLGDEPRSQRDLEGALELDRSVRLPQETPPKVRARFEKIAQRMPSASDSDPDPESESESESESDPESDPESESESASASASASATDSDSASATVSESKPESKPDPEPESDFGSTSDPEPESASDPDPASESERGSVVPTVLAWSGGAVAGLGAAATGLVTLDYLLQRVALDNYYSNLSSAQEAFSSRNFAERLGGTLEEWRPYREAERRDAVLLPVLATVTGVGAAMVVTALLWPDGEE